MPTNHITSRSASCARLMELALEAHDLVDLLLAEDMDQMEADIYVGGPAFLLSLVLDDLNHQLDWVFLTPIPARPLRLEVARAIASCVPPERRAKYPHVERAGALSPLRASIADEPAL